MLREYKVDCLVRYQWDGAGPHTSNELKSYINAEFKERGWLFVQQPSQSPLTNIKDCCLFPALSKMVSAQQGLTNGSHVMDIDKAWNIVQQCYNNMSMDTIARAYVHHHQMVNAINECNGGDEYAKRRGGLHCGIRRSMMTVRNINFIYQSRTMCPMQRVTCYHHNIW